MHDAKITALSSGLRVVSRNIPGLDSVSVGVWTNVGSRVEPLKLHGAAHFLEHLVFKGTPTRNARQISADIEGVGGYLNAVTGEESTCYYARARGSELRSLVNVLGDIYRNAVLDPAEVERERGVIREEILMYDEQPAIVAHEHLTLSLWPGDAVGRAITGTVQSIERISRSELLEFRKRHYGAHNTWLVAAGNVEHNELVAAARTAFADWQGAKRTPPLIIRPFKPAVHVFKETDNDQVQIAIGFRALHRQHPMRYALRVLNVLLGENMSSRLFNSLREVRGWAYSIGSHVQLFEGTGALIIQAGVEAGKWLPSLELILKECSRLSQRGISSTELRRAKKYAIGSTWLGLESASDVMFWMGESLVAYDRIVDPTESEEKISRVTASDVHNLAQEIFCRSARSIVAIGPGVNERLAHERLPLLV